MNRLIIISLLLLLSSCVSKNIIINDNCKYYAETNILKDYENGIILKQRVQSNNTNGLHSSWSFLTINFTNFSKIEINKNYTIGKDTSFLKVKYEFNSNRFWDLKTKSISGKIKINSISENEVEITENVYVIDEFDKKMKFKGTRIFKKGITMEKYPKMKRNKKVLWLIKNKG